MSITKRILARYRARTGSLVQVDAPAAVAPMAIHNAGHVMACLVTGQTFRFASAETCRGVPLGLRKQSDNLLWEAVCLAGLVAEATAGQPGLSDEALLERIRNEDQPDDSEFHRPEGSNRPFEEQSGAVLALAIVSANWQDIVMIALALARSGRPMSRAELLREVRNKRGADLGSQFERWRSAIAVTRPLGGTGRSILNGSGGEIP
ncbi:hypothetical protein LVY72_17730 [Arthrobacter sp. I2-34]|uniref:Uncharacterized protein n=1 Tax=Arthrobacter hankyongi TaxID=2904801 RepID=A0ABS9LAM5_9MICC|nr:hypothetical protein [Arthrobacter hankyongi]MCG2623738.1 hypothetical protein [Arthrobacter hankyongi]